MQRRRALFVVIVLFTITVLLQVVTTTAQSPSLERNVTLFDEEQIQAIYLKARPAVVKIDLYQGDILLTTGTGFVVSKQGNNTAQILTNYHLFQGKQVEKTEVTFSDGTSVPATILGGSPYDLALLRVEDDLVAGIQPLTLGNSSKVQASQLAITIGNPAGFDTTLVGTISIGVISGLNRPISYPDGRTYKGLLQTDASTIGGTSGGPLLNSSGEVIGVVAAHGKQVLSRIGFAIPANTVVQELDRLENGQGE